MRVPPLSVPARLALVCWSATLVACSARSASVPAPDVDAGTRAFALAEHTRENGQFAEALSLYADAGRTAAAPELQRKALLAEGLLRLQPDPALLDLARAEAALVHAHSLYAGSTAPAELTAMLWMLDELRASRTAAAARADAAHAAEQAARAAATRTDEDLRKLTSDNRELKRTVEQLRREVEKREAALKNAAQALLASPRPR